MIGLRVSFGRVVSAALFAVVVFAVAPPPDRRRKPASLGLPITSSPSVDRFRARARTCRPEFRPAIWRSVGRSGKTLQIAGRSSSTL